MWLDFDEIHWTDNNIAVWLVGSGFQINCVGEMQCVIGRENWSVWTGSETSNSSEHIGKSAVCCGFNVQARIWIYPVLEWLTCARNINLIVFRGRQFLWTCLYNHYHTMIDDAALSYRYFCCFSFLWANFRYLKNHRALAFPDWREVNYSTPLGNGWKMSSL